jgi:hypothetical protein
MNDRRRLHPGRLALLALVAALVSCVTPGPVLERPAGFALFEGERYRAVTPEGVVLGVRLVPNDPEQGLRFWAEALKVHMLGSGYRLLAEEPFKAPIGDGALFEWVAPLGGEDWVYLTAVAVSGRDIALVEAAGPFARYREHRGAVLTSLATINLPSRR